MANPTDLIAEITERAYGTELMGAAVTCTPPGGDTVALNAILSFGGGNEREGADGFGQTGTARIRVADMATLPSGTTLANGSETFEITYADLSPCGLEWVCEISKR